MTYDDYGSAVLFAYPRQKTDNVCAGLGVKIAGGFVGQQEGGIPDQCAGHRYALLLATGKFGGPVVHPVAEMNHLERSGCPLSSPLGSYTR